MTSQLVQFFRHWMVLRPMISGISLWRRRRTSRVDRMVRANVTTAGFCSRCCGGLLKEEGQNHVKPVKCNFSFGMSATKARCQLAAILSSIWIFSENALRKCPKSQKYHEDVSFTHGYYPRDNFACPSALFLWCYSSNFTYVPYLTSQLLRFLSEIVVQVVGKGSSNTCFIFRVLSPLDLLFDKYSFHPPGSKPQAEETRQRAAPLPMIETSLEADWLA